MIPKLKNDYLFWAVLRITSKREDYFKSIGRDPRALLKDKIDEYDLIDFHGSGIMADVIADVMFDRIDGWACVKQSEIQEWLNKYGIDENGDYI